MSTKERPILFSGPMVRAILEGRKTQTRRVISPQPVYYPKEKYLEWTDKRGLKSGCPLKDAHWWLSCPYGKAGDSLWVRETWANTGRQTFYPEGGGSFEAGTEFICAVYRATATEANLSHNPTWKPSIHMPRWASRITLEITQVRVERLQDISESDAEAEGVAVSHYYCDEGTAQDPTPAHRCDPVGKFRELWESINSKPGRRWEDNPWVWALTFKRTEGQP